MPRWLMLCSTRSSIPSLPSLALTNRPRPRIDSVLEVPSLSAAERISLPSGRTRFYPTCPSPQPIPLVWLFRRHFLIPWTGRRFHVRCRHTNSHNDRIAAKIINHAVLAVRRLGPNLQDVELDLGWARSYRLRGRLSPISLLIQTFYSDPDFPL